MVCHQMIQEDQITVFSDHPNWKMTIVTTVTLQKQTFFWKTYLFS